MVLSLATLKWIPDPEGIRILAFATHNIRTLAEPRHTIFCYSITKSDIALTHLDFLSLTR